MIVQAGDNIISSLGFTAEDNYRAVKSGRSGIRLYDSYRGIPEPFFASFIDREELDDRFAAIGRCEDYTPMERAAILSACYAAEQARIDLSDPGILFVFSSTKGNVHLLDEGGNMFSQAHLYLWHTAGLVAGYFHNSNTPVVISNACISGACAQIAAMRELESGCYGHAVVIGIDMLSKFIISGFQSLKALAPGICRPFDAGRSGLNLGEAASTIIYKKAGKDDSYAISLEKGAIRNDANHISGPSRTGEGCFLAMQATLREMEPDDLAFINAHGTATVYNDRMESVAITRAGLNRVPVNSLKGYFGHTLGAAGILESIISARALIEQTVLPTHGFRQIDPDYPLNVTERLARTDRPYCLKMLSGFGGCNAALLFKKNKKTDDALS
ncbi:MAG: beta-ketoacyl synthase [Tannerellaceae bacterium]|jgi:3-oxoacyl-[acyl-carrier-protein] synthase-1|nr:beta-ketoacyl synthase [Tannerellaceae bacterium]